MRTMPLGATELQVPVVAVGCMRLAPLSRAQAEAFIQTALEGGANFFDHADIYGGGRSESLFAEAIDLRPAIREQFILQSKCGIREGSFDFSKEHILSSVDGILRRLNTEYLDVLLLHRPDALLEPEEVAETFDRLEAAGKVRHFGVSNQPPMLMDLLRKYLHRPIAANQLQLSVTEASMIARTMHINMQHDDASLDRDGDVLDYCRLHDITVQPWSPFQYGFFEGVFLDNHKFPALNDKLNQIAARYGVTNTAITMAWLLRHPARMQPVTGTMNVERLKECIKAADIRLTREEWYEIYLAAGHTLP